MKMKDLMKNKKVWIAVAIVVVVFAWAMMGGDPAPEVTQ
jgi:uncharacterized phage infection (PIP) family protein YhgE